MNNGHSTLAVAESYLAVGLCVLPASHHTKYTTLPRWKPYQEQLPQPEDIERWFAGGHTGFCIVAGTVSGNLEFLDFDNGGELYDPWAAKIPPELLGRLVVEVSQSGGRHVMYRCEAPVCGNVDLAKRTVGGKTFALIQTRGKGGLCLCAPTPGYCLTHGELTALPVLTEEEHEILFQAARDLDETDPDQPPPRPSEPYTVQGGGRVGDGRPGDQYNDDGDVVALLEHHKWHRSGGVHADGNQHWTRPGKATGTSATMKDRTFYVFTSNGAPFTANKPYSPFAVFSLLEHAGEFSEAAAQLRKAGYGGNGPQ